MDQHEAEPHQILIVTEDITALDNLITTLRTAGGYQVSAASSFQEALDLILTRRFALALVDVKLPDLSGIDLLTAAGVLRSAVPTILIDDTLSTKSAVTAIRVGAIDYVSKPLNLDLVMMRIDRELQQGQKTAGMASGNGPSIALSISQEQFRQIDHELHLLYVGINAEFVGLVDASHNLIGSAGKLDDCDLLLLLKALGSSGETSGPLFGLLGAAPFYSTYFEGSENGVYIINFRQPAPVSLIVICPVKAKRGVVWLYSKRTAVTIDAILGAPQAAQLAAG